MADPETQDAELRETCLADRHRALGARMVPFAGYAMPVQYEVGIVAEHRWTRDKAGLFDVSHMGPCRITLTDHSGDADADHAAIAGLVEPLVSADIAGLRPGQVRYTLLLADDGGILDDLMVARPPADAEAGSLYVVVNAGTKVAAFAAFDAAIGDKASLHRADDGALLALQGPEAGAVLADMIPATAELTFMTYATFDWNGRTLTIARSGYTGEDGFEILAPRDIAADLWNALLADERVKPVGLGARDSLRLEAGLPLYGHDIDTGTNPVEAGLKFALNKARRERADFPGAPAILKDYAEGPTRIRVGLTVEGAPAREGAEILDASDKVIGTVTSGGFSPSLGRPIAMGYVPADHAVDGTQLKVSVRGRHQTATVTAMPFVPHRYRRAAV